MGITYYMSLEYSREHFSMHLLDQESRKASSVLCLEGFELIPGFLKFVAFDKNTEEEWTQREVQCGEVLNVQNIWENMLQL